MSSEEFKNKGNFGGGIPELPFPKDADDFWMDFDEFLSKRENICPFFYYSFTDLMHGDEGGIFRAQNPALSYHCYWREYNRCDNSLYLDEACIDDKVREQDGEKEYRGAHFIENTCLGKYGECKILKDIINGARTKDKDKNKEVLNLEGMNIPFMESENEKISEIIDPQIGKPSSNWFGKARAIGKITGKRWEVFIEALEHYAYRLSEFEDHYCQCKNPKKSDKAGFEDKNADRENKNEYNKRYCMKQFETAAYKVMGDKELIEKKANK